MAIAHKIDSGRATAVTASQRQCLSHLLRNSAAALEGLASLVEREDAPVTPAMIEELIGRARTTIDRIHDAAGAGTACSMSEEECAFAGKFFGCR
jgi:hypothetical protein